MSAQRQPPGETECPQCVVNFYAFLVIANDPSQPRNPIVLRHVAKVMEAAERRGFSHADNLVELIASGEHHSQQALWLGTRLGEAVGVELMQSMVSELIAELKAKQFNQPKGIAS